MEPKLCTILSSLWTWGHRTMPVWRKDLPKLVLGSNFPSVSIDGELTLFSGTTGQALKRGTGTGFVKVASGVVSILSAISHTTLTDIGSLTHATLDSYLNQAVKTTSSPAFAGATIGTLAGIILGTAGVLSALANGSADTKLFMNAAGTAPEWTSGIKLITGTRSMTAASGNVAYTGVGFKPSAVIALAANGGFVNMVSAGVVNGATNFCIYNAGNVGANFWGGTITLIGLHEGVDKSQTAVWASNDSDGFTLTWTYDEPCTVNTAQLGFLCFR